MFFKQFASNPELRKATLQDVRQKLLAAGATNHAGQGVDSHLQFVSEKVFGKSVVMCTCSCFGLTSTIIESLVQSLGQSDKEQSNNFCNGPIPLSNIHMNSK